MTSRRGKRITGAKPEEMPGREVSDMEKTMPLSPGERVA